MDGANPRKRQTAVIDEVFEQPPAKKLKTKKANGITFNTTGPKTTSRPQKDKADNSNAPTVYEKDGIRIPLFDENGRKRTARAVSTLKNKLSKQELFDLVERYGGKAELEKRREHPKDRLAQWINEKETKALGAGRRGGGMRKSTAPVTQTTPEPVNDPSTNVTVPGDSTDSMKPPPVPPRHSSSRPGQVRTPRHNEFKPSAMPTPQPHSRRPLTDPNKRLKDAASPSQVKKVRFNTTIVSSSPPPDPDISSEEDDSLNEDDLIVAMMEPDAISPIPPPSSPQPSRPSQFDRFARLIREYGLDPTNVILNTTVVEYKIKGVKETVILTASSDHTLHQTVLPSSADRGPQLRAYLKPGKHGWDFEKYRAVFEGDPDLETGVGHQVDRADRERLRQDSGFEMEFKKKYPGIGTGHQWPCGCMRLPEEGESEAE